MSKNHSLVTIIAITAVAAVILGEVFTYGINVHSYDSNAYISPPGTLNYSVSSKGSDAYSVVLMDRHDAKPVKKVYIYADENYDSCYKKAHDMCHHISHVEQKHHAEQMQKLLKIKGFKDATIVDSEKLCNVLREDIEKTNCSGHGLIVSSFSLPFDIYHGCPNDLLFKWIDNGGYLYWSSSEIGRFYYKDSKINEVKDYDTLFFGSKCINVSETERATSVIDNKFQEAFTLTNTGLKFALKTDAIPNSSNSLSIGYKENGYSSIAFVKHNNGMICVIGTMSEHLPMREDTTQIISAGITYDTEIVMIHKGNITRGKISDTIKYTRQIDNPIIYIYIGGTYTVYGRCFQ